MVRACSFYLTISDPSLLKEFAELSTHHEVTLLIGNVKLPFRFYYSMSYSEFIIDDTGNPIVDTFALSQNSIMKFAQLDNQAVHCLATLFPNITKMTVVCDDDLSVSTIEKVTCLLAQWSVKMVNLKLWFGKLLGCQPDCDVFSRVVQMFKVINSMPSIKQLTFSLGNYRIDKPISLLLPSQLEEFNLDVSIPRNIYQWLKQIEASENIKRVGLGFCAVSAKCLIEKVPLLIARITHLPNLDRGPRGDAIMLCAKFTSLTKVALGWVRYLGIDWFTSTLSPLTQLMEIYINVRWNYGGFKQPDQTKIQPMPSVKVFRLDWQSLQRTPAHLLLDSFSIPLAFPNVQIISIFHPEWHCACEKWLDLEPTDNLLHPCQGRILKSLRTCTKLNKLYYTPPYIGTIEWPIKDL